MRVFVTGSAGFIAGNLLPLLAQDHNKLLLLIRSKKDREVLKKHRANVIVGDLKNIKSIKQNIKRFDPQICVHLAWEGIPDFSPKMSIRNLKNSTDLLDYVINETNCKKIIISGSCFEYGKKSGVCKEPGKAKINSYFSWAKHSLYNYAILRCKEANIDLIWFRIFYVYGPGQRKGSLIPTLVHSFKNRIIPQIDNPLNANDFIYVRDVAEAFGIAANKKLKSGVYNLGSGQSTKVVDVCEIIERHIFGEINITNQMKKNINSSQTVNFWADISKTKNALGWFSRTSLYSGIEQYIKSLEKT